MMCAKKDKGGGMMERLTIDEIIEHCERKTKFYEEVGKSIDFETIELTDAIKEYWEHRQVKEYLEELKRYRDADEQGLLLRLPCKVGDKAWYVNRDGINEVIVDSFVFNVNLFTNVSVYIGAERFGKTLTTYKTLLFSKEEAEQKLKEMESD